MKNYKLPLLGFALVLLITSCKKEDVRPVNAPTQTSAVTSVVRASGWNSLSNWSTLKADSVTTYFSSVSDTAINADVAGSGLVLVYKKNGNDIQALPFQENGTYWYYQISKGFLRINGDNSDSKQNFSGQTFAYFVLTPQQLSDFQTKGKTKFDLMQLSYNQALVLFK